MGLVVVCLLAAIAWFAARAPGLGLLGPVVLSLVLGVTWRAAAQRSWTRLEPGARFAAAVLLRLGIVMLGFRMDFRALLELGPTLLAGGVLGVIAVLGAVEVVGRLWKVPEDLRRAVGMGTAVCGASAILAAMPVLGIRERQASVSVAAISLLGTVGVLLFVAVDSLAVVPTALLGIVAGATLQEVGQVVAAGTAIGSAEADLALLVKLSRVVMLAPLLLVLGRLSGSSGLSMEASSDSGGARPRSVGNRRPAIPLFVVGFLAAGLVASLDVVPTGVIAALALAGTALTAAAMVGVGLSVDVRGLQSTGRDALMLSLVGFLVLVGVMTGYYWLLLG